LRIDDTQAREASNRRASEREASGRGAVPLGVPRAATRWLIVRDGVGRLEPLCVDDGSGRILPVFSFPEEAEMFLRLGGHDGDGWRERESSAGELVSVLCGPCADAKSVALDPLPGMLGDGTAALVEVDRERFLKGITDGR